MMSNNVIQRLLLTVRIIHAAFLSTVLTTIIILALFQRLGFIPVFLSSDTTLVLAEIILGVFSLLCLTLGFIWPRLAKLYQKAKRDDVDVLDGLNGNIVRNLTHKVIDLLPAQKFTGQKLTQNTPIFLGNFLFQAKMGSGITLTRI